MLKKLLTTVRPLAVLFQLLTLGLLLFGIGSVFTDWPNFGPFLGLANMAIFGQLLWWNYEHNYASHWAVRTGDIVFDIPKAVGGGYLEFTDFLRLARQSQALWNYPTFLVFLTFRLKLFREAWIELETTLPDGTKFSFWTRVWEVGYVGFWGKMVYIAAKVCEEPDYEDEHTIRMGDIISVDLTDIRRMRLRRPKELS